MSTSSIYTQQSQFTDPGPVSSAIDGLPSDVGQIIEAVQGLMIYDVVAEVFYDYELPEERGDDIHLRPLEGIVTQVLALDDRGLTESRPVDKRVAGRCRDYVVLLVGALRHHDVPARARCGFATYFNPDHFEDHQVCEYWDSTDSRWKFADPQFDEVWRDKLDIAHDITDIPRDKMLVAADAWQACRSGDADPTKFGIEFADLRGLWFVAGSLVRDLAALNQMEMLPWDMWGAQPRPDSELSNEELEFFDRIAALTADPDEHVDEWRSLYQNDERLRVPDSVFNALRNEQEALS